jgi:hypothetical protein
VFLSGGLENEIREAFEHEVPDQRREIHVEIIAVIFTLLRTFDDSEVRIPLQDSIESIPPWRTIFLLFH